MYKKRQDGDTLKRYGSLYHIVQEEGVDILSPKKEKKIDLNNIKPEEKMKYEIATELGYMDKVLQSGWKSLSAKESGRIGGIMTKRRKEEQLRKKQLEEQASNQDTINERILDETEAVHAFQMEEEKKLI